MSRFKGIYWRTFTVTVGMVALTLVLLGASFFALTYSYIMSEKRNELRDKAEVVAQVAVSVYNKPGGMQIWGDMPNDLEEIADMAQQMSGTDFLIRMPSLGIYITTDESLNSMPITLPREIAARLAEGESYAGVTDLGVYEEPRFVVVVPARTGITAPRWDPCWPSPSPTP